MKKTYMQPCTEMVVLKAVTVMAGSLGKAGMTFDNNGGGSVETQDGNAVSDGMSRRSIWDDEE